MPGRLIRSLAYRMTLAVLGLSLALSVLSAAVLFALQYREGVKTVERDLEHLGQAYVPSISASLWVMDLQQLQIHLEGLRNIPHISRVSIEVKGQVLAAAGADRPGRGIDRAFPLSYAFGTRTMNLGTLHVRASLAGISAGLFSVTYLRLLFQTGQIFLMSIFMLLLLRLIVTRRLSALEHHLDGLDAGRLDAPFVMPRPSVFAGEDELDRVAVAVNDMGVNLKEAFRELETQRERLAVTLRSIGDGIITTDTRGGVTLMNEVAENLTGWMLGDAAGKPLAEVFPIVDATTRERRDNPVDQVLQTRGGVELASNATLIRRDGSEIIIADSAAPIREREGAVIGVVLVFRDITERIRLAEEKARLENQLQQAQKMESIGRLAGGVAHDFNNLTAIILGYGEMLLDQLGPEDPARKWVEQIVAAGRRSAGLTRQLLAFSRRQTLQPEVLDLNALLRNFEKMLGRLIGEDIQLEFKLAADVGRVTADPGQIEQIVTNLVINARDAMPLGGQVMVETANVDLDATFALGHESVVSGAYVLLALSDTGCGMDKATMARLFEPFFTTKEKGKGTGLGLATVYGIVKQSGGYIYAYSEPGQGTIFKIYLLRTDAEPAAKVAGAVAAAMRGQGELILLVEDETPLRELCETVLTRLGYRVSAGGSGPEALRRVQEQKCEPDLVVTDVIMPGMSGAEMVQRLRRDQPSLKVLYMSGYPDDVIAHHGVLAPGTLFVQKPFTEPAFATKVREALGERTVAAQPGRRVLMIDDDEQYRELVRHFCAKRGHVFVGVDSTAAALAALAQQSCDVLLVDLNIPGTSGERVLREIRTAGHAAPAIVLTGDLAGADMNLLRPLGAVLALEKSSNGEPLLQAIEETVPREVRGARFSGSS